MICRPEGPVPAKLMIVGEAPGAEEEARGLPFQGASGQELNRMLHEAGISRSEAFITNVARERPAGNDINAFIAKSKKDRTPAHREVRGKYVLPPIIAGLSLLEQELAMVRPNLVIALGGTALWALTGREGISKWRGSMLHSDKYPSIKVIPTLHPAAVLREWSSRATAVADLRRAAAYRGDAQQYPTPDWQFIVRPDFRTAEATLLNLLRRLDERPSLRLSFDLETRRGHIACAGLSWSLTEAICIPFWEKGRKDGYWNEQQEIEIVLLLRAVLTHKNANIVGQNILYDSQYTWRHWKFIPNVYQDCMISQHSLFSDLPKSLAYQASLYCKYYVFWKEEGKNI